ncbi:MAG: hypothetical protein ACK4GJ_02745 [bacterium]
MQKLGKQNVSKEEKSTVIKEILDKLKNVKIPEFESYLKVSIYENEDNQLEITSHQPLIYTPGVLAKFLFSNLNKIIIYNDSDKAEFKFLSKELNFEKPFEKLTKEEIENLIKFINHSWDYYKDFIKINKNGIQKTKENVEIFLDTLKNEKIDKFAYFWNQILVKYLEKWGINTNFQIKTLSEICQDKNLELPFKDYFYLIIDNYDDYYYLYNEAVDIFRKSLGFYPVKKLNPGETGFWIIKDKKRNNLLYLNGKIVIENTKETIENISNYEIRPKAVNWSLYRRYFIYKNHKDILGIGSSYYNFVCDYIAINLFNFLPPSTISVSLSLSLEDNQTLENELNEITNLKSLLNSFKSSIFKNPEKLSKILSHLQKYEKYIDTNYLSENVKKIEILLDKNLLKQKLTLIEQINNKEYRHLKKELTQKLIEINNQLLIPIKPFLEDLQKSMELSELQIERLYKEYKSLNSRDYPYFLISPLKILEKLEDEK